MSVLIKDMEMPTTCCNCKFREPFIDFAYCHLAEMDMEYEESDNCRHPKCPLVEIPTPHGRRIVETGDCNSCSESKNCKYVPKLGEQVRYNCPFYKRR